MTTDLPAIRASQVPVFCPQCGLQIGPNAIRKNKCPMCGSKVR